MKLAPALALVIGLIAAAAVTAAPASVNANPLDDYTKTRQQLADQAAQVETLSDELRLLDQTVAAKSEYLAQLTAEAGKVRGELADVNRELGTMQRSRQSAQGRLNRLVRTDYVDGRTNAYFVLAGADSLSTMTAASSYLGIFQERTDGLVSQLDQLERRQSERQRDVTARVQRLDQLEDETQRESAELAAVRDAKQKLLESTQGQEDIYRQQFEAARDELVKMGIFGKSGCARVGSRVWPEAGGYFNQCDPRWADAHLGFSDSSTLGDYGCGVASLAMVYRTYGGIGDTDPLQMNQALRGAAAFSDDLLWWSRVGGAYGGRLSVTAHNGGADWGAINGELAAGRPVMVYIDRGATNHYVVLLQRDGSTYRMNDPIEGPSLRFSDHYSTGAVRQYVTFRR